MEKWSIISNENDVMIRIKIIRKAVLKKKISRYIHESFLYFIPVTYMKKDEDILSHILLSTSKQFLLLRDISFNKRICCYILCHDHEFIIPPSSSPISPYYIYTIISAEIPIQKKDPRFCWKKKTTTWLFEIKHFCLP